jgi:hypothetical protein
MLIMKCVKDLPPFFARADEAHLAQSSQLMRHGGLGHFESFRQSADAHLALDDSHAAGVTEGAEKFSKLDGFEFGEFHNI